MCLGCWSGVPIRRNSCRPYSSEAEQLATDLGVDLSLPAAVPRHDRKCDLVEDGGAFISWDGAVHPCYFLWHQFRCFINDWDRLIKPKVFGNVNERPLLDIWNGEAFRSFREKCPQIRLSLLQQLRRGPLRSAAG